MAQVVKRECRGDGADRPERRAENGGPVSIQAQCGPAEAAKQGAAKERSGVGPRRRFGQLVADNFACAEALKDESGAGRAEPFERRLRESGGLQMPGAGQVGGNKRRSAHASHSGDRAEAGGLHERG